MSLNMFPNELTPDLRSDLDYDKVEPRGPGEGEGPYGSYNTEYGAGVTGPLEKEHQDKDLSLNQDYPPPKWGPAKYGTVTSELFPPDLVQQVLDAAFIRARGMMTPIVADAIRERMNPARFRGVVFQKADDLLEIAVYQEVMSRDTGIDLRTLTPAGVVEFLDYFMAQNNGRVTYLETLLTEAFDEYWRVRHQTA